MTLTDADIARIRAERATRRGRANVAMYVGVLAVVALGALRAEAPESAVAQAGVWAAFAAAAVAFGLNSRCPACSAWLNAVPDPRYCSGCGVPLR